MILFILKVQILPEKHLALSDPASGSTPFGYHLTPLQHGSMHCQAFLLGSLENYMSAYREKVAKNAKNGLAAVQE
jgi:hypothetical protein